METTITDEALSGDAQLTSRDAGSAGGSVAPTSAPDAMTLSEINAVLGKTFPTKEAALKSFKDTFSYVGKKQEDAVAQARAELQMTEKTDKLAQELEEMRKERFFDKNPQYADSSTRKLIERLGSNPADVVQSEEFQTIFTKAQSYEETQKLKTVLESNPRLASSRDNLVKAVELQTQGAPTDAIEQHVVSAVKEAFQL